MAAKIVDTRKLEEPVEVTLKVAGKDEPETRTITELEIHAFKARDMKALDGLAETQSGSIILAFSARITRQPVKVIEELGKADFEWVAGWAQDFLPGGRPTGETGSGT